VALPRDLLDVAVLERLEKLPSPAYDLIDFDTYERLFGIRKIAYATSVGCPYACNYCTDMVFYKRRFIAYSADRVISEVTDLVERYRLVDYEVAKEGLERDAKENFQVQQNNIDPNYKGKHLQLEFTVEDEGVFKMPWSATMTYRPQVTEWEESICAENPHKYGTEKDVAVPTALKPDF